MDEASASSSLPALSPSDLELLVEALDAYEYWQLGEVLPRSDGLVWVPGDCIDAVDRYWQDVVPMPDQAAAIEAVLACRRLADELRSAIGAAG